MLYRKNTLIELGNNLYTFAAILVAVIDHEKKGINFDTFSREYKISCIPTLLKMYQNGSVLMANYRHLKSALPEG